MVSASRRGFQFEELSHSVIGCAIEVHRILGPGLLESAYQRCLTRELQIHGLSYEDEVPLPIQYKGVDLECGYRIDLIVDHKLIVELKAVETVVNVHRAQLLTYMKLTSIHIGLLINFHVPLLREGIERFVL